MTSQVTMKCWICPETFSKPIEVKNHAIDKHDVCRLICPWCLDKKETFKRMSELSKHSKRKHPDLIEELKEMDFFSETNGFWLAVRPQDYAKAVKPSDWPNVAAMRTMAALVRWIENRGGKEKEIDEWETRWNQALGIKPVHQTPSNRKRKVPQYSPGKPEMSTVLDIVSISLTSAQKVAYLKMEETSSQLWYKVDFQPWIVEDKKAMENLLRRMAFIKDDIDPPKKFGTALKLQDISFTLQRISSVLGVGDKHVKSVAREICKVERLTEAELEKTTAGMMDFGDEPEYEIIDTLEDEKTEKDNTTVVSRDTERDQCTISVEKQDRQDKVQIERTLSHQEVTLQEKEQPVLDVLQIAVEESVIDRDEVSQTPSIISSPDLERDELSHLSEQEQDMERQSNHQKRAEVLLKVGGMPLFPPARRQWGDWQIIILRTPTVMYWPPKNWTTLSPEEKLTAWRFAAYALERENGTTYITSERDTLDKFAMLALPGTKIETVSTRLGNYNMLCKIYKGEMTDSEAEGWLTMFERAVGDDGKQQHLYKIMKDIPLSLTK